MKINIQFSLTSFSIVLTCILFMLKVLGYISWDWIWIFSPIWGSFAIFCVLISIFMIIVVVKSKIEEKRM